MAHYVVLIDPYGPDHDAYVLPDYDGNEDAVENEWCEVVGMWFAGVREADTKEAAIQLALDDPDQWWVGGCVA